MAEVEHDDFERLTRSVERVGRECACGVRLTGHAYVVDHAACCSLECLACELGERHAGDDVLVCDNATIARIVKVIKAEFRCAELAREHGVTVEQVREVAAFKSAADARSLDELHATANEAALYTAGIRATVRPEAA